MSKETLVAPQIKASLTRPSYPEQVPTRESIAAAMEVPRALGPGLLALAYQACLCRELKRRNLDFVQPIELPLTYNCVKRDCGYGIDLIVSDRIVTKLKSVEEVLPVREA